MRMLVKKNGVLTPVGDWGESDNSEPIDHAEKFANDLNDKSATKLVALLILELATIAILAVAVAIKKRWQHAKSRDQTER